MLINNLAHMLLQRSRGSCGKIGTLPALLFLSICLSSWRKNNGNFQGSQEVVYGYLGRSNQKLIFRAVLPNSGLLALLSGQAPQFGECFSKKRMMPRGTVLRPDVRFPDWRQTYQTSCQKPCIPFWARLMSQKRRWNKRSHFSPGCVGDKMYVDMSLACIKVFRHHDVAIFYS